MSLFFRSESQLKTFILIADEKQVRKKDAIKIISLLNASQKLSVSEVVKFILTIFRMGFFRAAHEWWWEVGGGAQKGPLPKIYHTYPTMTKLNTTIIYVKIQKIHESRDTPLEF